MKKCLGKGKEIFSKVKYIVYIKLSNNLVKLKIS